MRSYPETLKLLLDDARQIRNKITLESICLREAVGRVCGESIIVEKPMPPFDNSAMDGFALRSMESAGASSGNPITFKIAGSILAGDVAPQSHGGCQRICYEIMTGAPFPGESRDSFDACVKVEDVQITYSEKHSTPVSIQVYEPVTKYQHKRLVGEDLVKGDVIIHRGEVIRPEHVMALATQYHTIIKVFRTVRVGIISTGKEIENIENENSSPKLEDNFKIADVNAPYIRAALEASKTTITQYIDGVGDDETHYVSVLKKFISRDQSSMDLLISTGGVSKGKADFIEHALHTLGAEVIVHGVAMHPGHPVLIARFPTGQTYFGLPGNCVATSVTLRFIVSPYIAEMLHRRPEKPIRSLLTEPLTKRKGFRCFMEGFLHSNDRCTSVVHITPRHSSSKFSALLRSNAWVIVDEEVESLSVGQSVDVYRMQHY